MLKIGIQYFIFVLLLIIVAVVVLFKSKIRNPVPLMAIFTLLVVIPFIFGYFYITSFNSIPEVSVPNLKGLDADYAVSVLAGMNLHGKVEKQLYENSVEEGKIINHYPEAGRSVKTGRTINLFVSLGKYKTAVPNLIGKSLSQAIAILKASNLSLGDQIATYDEAFDEGIIISQTPSAEEMASAGSSVEVVVNTR